MIASPLTGRRVLVTRALEDSGAWAERLSALGADPVILPCIRTEIIDTAETRARLSSALRDADWLCITSPRGADAVAMLTAPLAQSLHIAVVGDATSRAVLTDLGRTSFVARGGTSRALAEELVARELSAAARPARIVIAGAEGGRTDAEEVFGRAGDVCTRVNVYRTVAAPRAVNTIDLAAENIGDVLLASPSAVEGLLNLASSPASARIFTIGPTTSAAVVAAGLSVSGEAARPDLDSLVEAMQ